MNARELANNVKLASEIYDDRSFDFDPNIQDRTLDEADSAHIEMKGRVREEIAEYLKRQPGPLFFVNCCCGT